MCFLSGCTREQERTTAYRQTLIIKVLKNTHWQSKLLATKEEDIITLPTHTADLEWPKIASKKKISL